MTVLTISANPDKYSTKVCIVTRWEGHSREGVVNRWEGHSRKGVVNEGRNKQTFMSVFEIYKVQSHKTLLTAVTPV